MKLDDLDYDELRELESLIGQLLIDYPYMKLSELQDKLLDLIEQCEELDEET